MGAPQPNLSSDRVGSLQDALIKLCAFEKRCRDDSIRGNRRTIAATC